MRKPHGRLSRLVLRLLLAGLGCSLIPQLGLGQLPIVENRAPFTLGAPCEPEKAMSQVVEFEPTKRPIPQTIVLPPTTPPIVVHEATHEVLPKILTVAGFLLPTTPPFSTEPPLWEIETPPNPILPSVAKVEAPAEPEPFERPTFGVVAGMDAPAEIVIVERAPALVYGFNESMRLIAGAGTAPELAVVRFETPMLVPPMIALDDYALLDPNVSMAQPLPKRVSRQRSYMDRLGSRDGTPHLAGGYVAYQPVPMRYATMPVRRIPGVLHWAFASVTSVREGLFEPFHYFD